VEAGSKPGQQVAVAGEPLDKERSRICRKACDYIRCNPHRQADIAKLSPIPRPAIVLDTNVVLDWLLFSDASMVSLAAEIMQGRVHWIATAAMRDEFVEVLRRGLAAKHNADAGLLLAAWDAHANVVTEHAWLPSATALHCSDPDDQKFLDLAQCAGARWLLSRDRAVLKLARNAAACRLSIIVPERWVAMA
jgi:predicted nucleic acid-binding protein